MRTDHRALQRHTATRARTLATGAARVLVLGAGLLVLHASAPLPTHAQDVATGGDETLTVRGILSTTLFANDQLFAPGNGQNAIWAAPPDDADDSWYHGADVRATRLGLDFNGPDVSGDWRVGGTIEVDFFGGVVGTGAFSDEQPMLRLRLGYIDLTNGRTTLRVGQAWSPTFGFAPESLSRIGFAHGWAGGGLIGWRLPGVFLYHDLSSDGPTTLHLQLAAMRGSWSDDVTPDGVSAGEASSVPQLEARLEARHAPAGAPSWEAFVAGHYDRKDLDGAGVDGDDSLDGWTVNGGVRIRPEPFTLIANAYVGEAAGQIFAHILQFGDFGGWGANGQLGFDLTPRWSIWGLYGIDDPDDDAPQRLQNQVVTGMLRYQVRQYAAALEWHRITTDHRIPLAGETSVSGNQLALSVRYTF
ncbi:MAG TPA: hypothetical protein VK966_09550 [Longimicrobiales bacterium]|nr:hypothetical protein [Longimicrobiales bacterium]